MDNDDDLASKIATAVTKEFGNLKIKSGKPITRSNGVKEWTVLAGLVALQNDKISVLSLTTGVKAMPEDTRKYSSGWIVHDMHAEILCLRLFNWFLLNQIKCGSKTYLEKAEGDEKFRLRSDIKLALYISEPPCGDASMSTLSGEAWKPKKQKTEIVRGRAHFDQLGIVRTKPGRADSKVTLSKSCSDKLCLKQKLGINSGITSLLVEPIYLDYLVIREDKYFEEDFDRCFSRIAGRLKALTYKSDSYEHYKNEGPPSPLSLLYCVPTKTTQVLNNGVKNGAFVKNKPPKPSGSSIISNRSLAKLAGEITETKFKSYKELKDANTERQELKKTCRKELGNWVQTGGDDFTFLD